MEHLVHPAPTQTCSASAWVFPAMCSLLLSWYREVLSLHHHVPKLIQGQISVTGSSSPWGHPSDKLTSLSVCVKCWSLHHHRHCASTLHTDKAFITQRHQTVFRKPWRYTVSSLQLTHIHPYLHKHIHTQWLFPTTPWSIFYLHSHAQWPLKYKSKIS